MVPRAGRSGSATSRSVNVTSAPSAVSVIVSPSSETVGRDVSTAASQVSWSISVDGSQAIIVVDHRGTTSTSPSSVQVDDSWLHPAVAREVSPSNVSVISCRPRA